jgi:hypothetical protein
MGGMGVLVWSLMAGPAQTAEREARDESRRSAASTSFAPVKVPLEELPAEVRERVRSVVEHPTLSTQGPVEVFNCDPATYAWLVDHPDQGVRLWRTLGAKCADICDNGNGRFSYQDNLGSEVHWDTVLSGPRQRVWYAEGQVRPGMLLPTAHVKAVAVLDFVDGFDSKGRPAVKHQLHVLVHTDSHAVALAARILGSSAPHMAEQYVAQVEMFFGALAWYLDQHPEHAKTLIAEVRKSASNK